jgi:hypothetical protein
LLSKAASLVRILFVVPSVESIDAVFFTKRWFACVHCGRFANAAGDVKNIRGGPIRSRRIGTSVLRRLALELVVISWTLPPNVD